MSAVDIFVPCYNYGHLLEESVRSALTQHGVDVRVLILDDASPDNTEAVGRRLAAADPRVEYRRHAANIGHIRTYNEGLEWSRAEYSVLLSADDALTPGSLARVTRMMDAHPEVTLAFGNAISVEYGAELPPVHNPPPQLCTSEVRSYRDFLLAACTVGHTDICAPTAVARLSTHRRVGWYRPEHPHSGDTEVWLRLASQGSVGFIDADQAYRRVHGANMSFNYSPLHRLSEHLKAFDTHFAEYGMLLPDLERFRARVNAALGEQAFWLGSRAFDDGDLKTCDACVAFATELMPSIRQSRAWSRLEWKRRIGPTTWRLAASVVSPVVHTLSQWGRLARNQSLASK